jgi:outer membrane receptor protein involved in Fe transport
VGQDRFRAFDAWGTRDFRIGATTALGFTGRFATGTADDYPDSSGGPVYGSGELRHTDRQDLLLGTKLAWGEGRRQHVTVGVSRRDLDRTSPAVEPFVPASTEHTEFTRLRVAYEAPLVSGARTTLDAGVSGEGEWGTNRSVLDLPPYLGGETPGDYDHSRATGGAYVGLRQQAGPVLLEAALRADAAEGAAAQANPHVGLVWSLDSAGATRLRASFGRASKLPSFFALSSPRALGGNPDLKPERALGGDVGIDRALVSHRLDGGVAYFRQEYRDLVVFDFDVFQLVNRNRVNTQGVEMFLRWRGPSSFSAEARVTWLEAEDLDGAALLHRPCWNGGAKLDWRPGSRVALHMEWRGVSSSLDQELTVPDRSSVAGHGVVGAAGSFKWREHWTARVRLDNLLDRAYETLIGFPGPGRSWWAGLAWGT